MSDFADEHDRPRSKDSHPQTKHDAHDAVPDSSGPSAATKPSDEVLTKWLVNYGAVLGKRKDPTRTPADQLIVEELKIQPDQGTPTALRGGNAARSGRVHLGDAKVAKGPGSVAAAVRYGTKSTFHVVATLSPAPNRSERLKLREVEKRATRRALEEASTEGNYASIAAQLRDEFAGEFEGKDLQLEIIPAPARKAKDEIEINPLEDHYSADGPSTFEVFVEPQDNNQQTNSETIGGSEDVGTAQSHTEGNTVSSETDTQIRHRQADEETSRFVSSMSESVTSAFKQIQNQLDDIGLDHVKHHEGVVTWKGGVAPDNGKGTATDPTKAPKPPGGSGGGDGLLHKAWHAAKNVGQWVYRKGLRRIPLLKEGLDLAFDAWDAIKTRVYVDRTSAETDGTSDTTKFHHQGSAGTEIQDLNVIAETLTNEMVTTHKQELETMVATKLGSEVSSSDKNDHTNKKTVSSSVTKASTTYEARRPKIRIRKLS